MKFLLPLLLLAACAPQPGKQSLLVWTPTGTGSAWPITETEFLTAWHVVEGSAFVTVGGIMIDEITQLPDIDGALLRVEEGHGFRPWPIDEDPLRGGEELLLTGWGGGLHWFTRGLAAGPRRASISIAPGDSGGPLLDWQGEVRGIVVGQGFKAQHHTWLIPIGDLMDAIRLQSTPPDPPPSNR